MKIGDIVGFWFVDRTHGFGEVGRRLVRSDDSGTNWRVLGAEIPTDKLGYLPDKTMFVTVADGYLYGRGLRITHDGGLSWADPQLGVYNDPRDGPEDGQVLALQPRGRSVWAFVRCVDRTGCIDLYVSDDGGSTWRKQSTPMLRTGQDQINLIRVTDTIAYALATGGLEQDDPKFALYHHVALTIDGGATWQYRPDPCRESADEELAVAGDHLWLACGGQPATEMESKELYRSDDQARHWRLMAASISGAPAFGVIPAPGHLTRLVAVSGVRAYLGLDRFTQIQTIDGGRTWRASFPAPGAEGGLPLNFVDSTHGWAIGDTSLYRTTDGLHWQRLGGADR